MHVSRARLTYGRYEDTREPTEVDGLNHLRDASKSGCSRLLASLHAVEAHTDRQAHESSTT
eukprot:5241076-Prymnesium_polylepis.1